MEVQRATKKRRKYSKKSKKNLRKYTDIRDVEEFLEEQRFQERTGGLVSEKKNEQLFYVQSEATAADERRRLSRSDRRKRPLRSLSHLHRDPVISGPDEASGVPGGGVVSERESRARRVWLGGAPSDSSEDEEEYEVSSRFSVRKQRESRELVRAVHKRLKKSKLKPVVRDIWASDSNVLSSAKDVPDEHFLRVTRKLPVKKPESVGGRPSALSTVSLPPPGASYNPAFDDHQELLQSAVDVEEARIAADQKINKKLEAMEPMTANEREKVWQEEMIEGLIEGQEGEGEGEGEEEAGDGVFPNTRPTVAGERKTRQRRRREEERRNKERQKLAAKMLKSRMNDVYRLRSLKKVIEEREGAVSEIKRKRQLAKEEEPFRTKRLGRLTYMDPDIDVQLSSEISGALRSLKCEGSLFRDRYKSLQKRNIIEPRQRVRPHRKFKLKLKEKRSTRLPEELGISYFPSNK